MGGGPFGVVELAVTIAIKAVQNSWIAFGPGAERVCSTWAARGTWSNFALWTRTGCTRLGIARPLRALGLGTLGLRAAGLRQAVVELGAGFGPLGVTQLAITVGIEATKGAGGLLHAGPHGHFHFRSLALVEVAIAIAVELGQTLLDDTWASPGVLSHAIARTRPGFAGHGLLCHDFFGFVELAVAVAVEALDNFGSGIGLRRETGRTENKRCCYEGEG